MRLHHSVLLRRPRFLSDMPELDTISVRLRSKVSTRRPVMQVPIWAVFARTNGPHGLLLPEPKSRRHRAGKDVILLNMQFCRDWVYCVS